MPRSCYCVEQIQSQWVVSVGGARVLSCRTKRTAVKAARRAMVLLHRCEPVQFPDRQPLPVGRGDDLLCWAASVLRKAATPRPS
jgi:hypothetical protein